jgi:hypothetical protein
MNALAQIEEAHPMRMAADIAVSLADEGVPVRAIARSIRIPGENVYELLKAAISAGRLLELPKDDWPPGGGRHNRSQVEKTVLAFTDQTLHLACANRFKLTRLQSVVFVAMLRRGEASKAYLHNAIENNRDDNAEPTDQKMVDVVVCHVRRKLKDDKVLIDTIWGVGYAMKVDARNHALAVMADHLAATGV